MSIDSKIKSWVERKLEDDADYSKDCGKYDEMISMQWDLPDSLSAYSWVRKRVSTVAADIVKQACNIFDTFNPKFELLPRGPEDEERAEKLERWGEFQMMQANALGDVEPFREIMRSSVAYDRICAQMEYADELPYEDKPETPFCVYVHHPSCVHYDMGGGVVRRVAVVSNVYASSVVEHWEAYEDDSEAGKKVSAALSKLRKLTDDEARVIYADYTDLKRRVVFFCETKAENIPGEFEFPDDVTIILDSENKRKFINWAIVKGSSGSLVDSLYKSGLLENQNFLDTLSDSTIIRRAFWPLLKHTSATGKDLQVDFDAEASGVVEQGPGEQTEVLVPPPLDPGVRELMDRNAAKMNSTSGVQNISSMQAANVQYATINAIIQLKMTELEPYKRNAEKVLSSLMKMMYLFVKDKNATVVSRRSAQSKYGNKGDKIVISPDDFEPKDLIITCTLLPNTPTDTMQKVNMFMQMKQAGLAIPDSEFVERLDFGDSKVNRDKWEKEQVENTLLEAFKQKKLAEVQLEVQQAQMAMQAQMQQAMQAQSVQMQPPQGQVPPDQGMPAMNQASGQANNPGQGGNSPYESAPQFTQTQMQP